MNGWYDIKYRWMNDRTYDNGDNLLVRNSNFEFHLFEVKRLVETMS
jgi:hypothetical protein